ncbi:response regulator of zinc sigma-54-dependent two-component system [Aquipluma nitroreducens]|uniref:Response regulator of zinc sigma-54-dependent two-component system n=1 Tax=Aquipluma nitroreducens TaxID=2010828 RepID=A0A5K7SFS1_9BACT|nr:sigma-54 dependent transcriptional regulator [Aquipluma nitroreducens]BBE20393.1 response regulator of zinc sigma-54-dependent two-component system [Aquipluma nitroreducens]
MANILIVDDDATFCLMLKKLLERHKFRVTTSFSPQKVKSIVKQQFYDVVLTDLRMPDISGMEIIRLIKRESPETQTIMMTEYADIATAIQSIRQGAFNYIPKPFQPEEVINIIREALEAKVSPVDNRPNNLLQNDFLFGTSKISLHLKGYVELVSPTSLSVLITGESGTGKEYIARLIHNLSQRNVKPFVAVDCGAIPTELVASEFFGHIKGSFTGAISDKTGHFEQANGGTLFLDEVGNLSYSTQIQLLRTLQERSIKPVGSNYEIPVDVRIIAATNENLQLAQEQGNFRDDLFHRLNEFEIKMPPLREREDDILLFAHHFLAQANSSLNKDVQGFEPEVEAVFRNYAWPGNLREMKNVVKRATLLSSGRRIGLNEISPEIYRTQQKDEQFRLFNETSESELIQKVLETVNYNKSKAARLLKIDRKTLYNKLKLYQIEIP